MNILIGPLRFVPFAADIPVSLLVAVHFEQRVERLEVGGEVGDVVLQEQGVLLGKGDLQPGEHVVTPGKGAGDIRGYVFVVGETVPCQAVLGIWASGISWDLGGTGGTGS